MILDPAVVVRDHRYGGVSHLRFASQLGFGHVSHPYEVAAPRAVHERFGSRREWKSIHDDVRAATYDIDLSDF